MEKPQKNLQKYIKIKYNLLKTIEPSLQRIFTPSTSFSHLLTPFPAHDFVNIGDLYNN